MDPGKAYSLICQGDHESITMASFVEEMMDQDDDVRGVCTSTSSPQVYNNSITISCDV
jgi:hypothetical protein